MATIFSTPTTVTVTNVGQLDPVADFQQRIAGCVWSENWANYSNAQQAATSPGFWGSNTPPSSPNFPNVFQIVTTPGHVLSGKALRVTWNPGAEGNWTLFLGGNRNNIPSNYFTKFYIQMICYPAIMDYSFKENGGAQGTPKLCIVDYHNSSSNAGEMVLTNQDCHGFVTAYTRHTNGASNGLYKPRATSGFSLNNQMQNAIDRGTPTSLTSDNAYQQRYGPFTQGMTGGHNQGTLSTQGTPDPDARIGGAHWNIGSLIVLEIEVQLTPNRARYWWAPYSASSPVAPILVADTNLSTAGEHSFGTRNDGTGIGWSGVQLTNFTTNSGSTNNPSPNNYTDWAELIFSTQPIRFPGGFSLP